MGAEMAAIPATKPATYDDVLAAPEHLLAEIMAGELVLSPRPRAGHSFAASSLGRVLGPAWPSRGQGGPPSGWWILYEPELHLGADVLVPDLAGWRASTLPQVPDVAAIELTPEWVCEILSPATARYDRIKKLSLYADHGVEWAWLIDPALKTLEIFRRLDSSWVRHRALEGEGVDEYEPFVDCAFDLGDLWLESWGE